jgi:hypothetical protein
VLVALSVMPAVDLIACPDGCTDAASQLSIHQSDAMGAHTACNLCVNGIAVDRVETPVANLVRLAPIARSRPYGILASPPPLVDHPPRLS